MNAQIARLVVLLEKAVARGDRLAATNLRAQIARLERS